MSPTAPLTRPPSTVRIGSSIRLRTDRRAVVVCVALAALCVVAAFVTLGTGSLPVSPMEVLRTVVGRGAAGNDFVVMDIGLPRACNALLVGAALGVAGALIQALTRNPLGSPDVVGFDSGAATGALIGLLILNVGPSGVSTLAVVGGLATAAAVYFFSAGGSGNGYRLILVGIGVGATLTAVNSYLLTRSRSYDSLVAARWLAGSLNDSTWRDVTVIGIGLVLLLPCGVALSRQLRIFQLGEETAAALGVRVGRLHIAVLAVSVGLAALAISTAGPVSFVALVAPQLVARVTRGAAPQVVSSALMGALLLTVSDFVAQRAFGSTDLPVGVVTGGVGGVYLVWLLSREWRKVSA
ncbi:FecCD family ABC transporter permease [Luteipulveratus mongoliensis]|uniref:ABC transporter permease n=1 Tax=Luteipulveratus mongoliensis TaxID=571913 RepID=A0A0K1JNJ2_9MICO|nr:iron chelate uptake ABC transporter family permease subunit [Luteipulveratus mongoliensis]AKU18277.1 hypothetical protein VV02_24565 [Luteipulveratus mongoliensis]